MRPLQNYGRMVLLLPAALIFFNGCATNRHSRLGIRPDSVSDGRAIVNIARNYIGIPYRYGGKTPQGFDCSGYVRYVYARAGFLIPRGSAGQYRQLESVRVPHPGDLVFFRISGRSVSHVGIYVGNYRFLHSPRTGRRIGYADIRNSYWSRRYAGARTVFLR